MNRYFVRFGIQHHVGLLEDRTGVNWLRGARVVCRTSRGVELGEILNRADLDSLDTEFGHGEILRPLTDNDRLLDERLSRFRDRAFEACQSLLTERGISTPLVDVEQLHDGEHLFFYFLGDPEHESDGLVADLAEKFGQKIKLRQFAEVLANGCGPTCGTAEGTCGTSCGSCSLGGRCKTPKAMDQSQG